jgi:predicted transcriptional regulator
MTLRHRARIEINREILEAANGRDVTVTKIMYMANLSHFQLKQYLKMLIKDGLLQYDPESRTFKTTEKGLIVLKTYSQLVDIVKKNKEQTRLQKQEEQRQQLV